MLRSDLGIVRRSWLEIFRQTVRAEAVSEFRLRVIANIHLQRLPILTAVPDILTGGTDRQKALEQLDFLASFFEIAAFLTQIVNKDDEQFLQFEGVASHDRAFEDDALEATLNLQGILADNLTGAKRPGDQPAPSALATIGRALCLPAIFLLPTPQLALVDRSRNPLLPRRFLFEIRELDHFPQVMNDTAHRRRIQASSSTRQKYCEKGSVTCP